MLKSHVNQFAWGLGLLAATTALVGSAVRAQDTPPKRQPDTLREQLLEPTRAQNQQSQTGEDPGPRQARPGEGQPGGIRVTANKPVADGQQPRMANYAIAECLRIENDSEVKMADLALSKAKHESVREFATMLKKEHQAMLQKLEKVSGSTPDGQAGLRSGDGTPVNASAQQDRQSNQERGFDYLAVKQEIADQCLTSAREEWEKKGQKCDMAYVGTQIVAHMHMINSGKVLRQYATGETQKLIDEGIQVAEQHHKQAEKLIEKLAEEERQHSKK